MNMKTVCIYHSIDLDGWMSAAIVKHYFFTEYDKVRIYNTSIQNELIEYRTNPEPNDDEILVFMGYNYGQPIPDLSEFDKIIMCDISFPVGNMKQLIDDLQQNFIWIDHHISAINSIPSFVSYNSSVSVRGMRDTKYAACELTWLYFMTDSNKTHFYDGDVKSMPEIVRLLGLYDSFRHKGTDEEQKVLEFQYGARIVISNYEQAYDFLISNINHGDSVWESIHIDGVVIYRYLCVEAKSAYKNGFPLELYFTKESGLRPVRFICINKERFNPINFGIDYHKDGYDGCACFHYDGVAKLWRFSLYNDNGEVDCSSIAKQFGGGGHRGASGFAVKSLTEVFNIV